MDNLIDKIKNLITPAPSTPRERAKSLRELGSTTRLLEQRADYAEAEAKLLDRAKKAKKRIKTARRGTNRRLLYVLAGLVFLVIIIMITKGGC